MSDSDLTYSAFRFQRLQVGQVCSPVQQIVYLQYFDVIGPEETEGLGNLVASGRGSAAPDLRGELELVPAAVGDLADYGFAVAVHGRCVQEDGTGGDAVVYDGAADSQVAIAVHIEGPCGPEADYRDLEAAQLPLLHAAPASS